MDILFKVDQTRLNKFIFRSTFAATALQNDIAGSEVLTHCKPKGLEDGERRLGHCAISPQHKSMPASKDSQ